MFARESQMFLYIIISLHGTKNMFVIFSRFSMQLIRDTLELPLAWKPVKIPKIKYGKKYLFLFSALVFVFHCFFFAFLGCECVFFFPFCFNRFELIGTRERMTKDMRLVLPKDTNKSIAIWTKSLLPKDYWRDAEEDIREILISLMDRENCI